jgi:acyl-CoA synthetase (AMP-forming)/AMP-acid ligase II
MSTVDDLGDDPGTWPSIPALTAAAADRFGDRVAIADGATTLTYAELLDEARTFGAALVAAGIEPGDRVALWAYNCAEWVVALLGLFQAGAVLVPVNTRFKGAEAADVLARSRARLLVTVTDFLGTDYVALLDGAGVDLPDLDTIVVAHGPRPDRAPGRIRARSWVDFRAGATDAGRDEVARRAAAVGTDDPSDILFTSGTTGVPKGVVQTHGRTLRVATDWVAMTGLTAGDRYLMVNPYFHMFGLKAGILASVAAGATMLPEAVFDVDRVLTRVTDEQVTVLPGAPTLYQALLDHPDRDRHDLSSLRVAVTGAADIPVALIRRIDDELPFSVVVTGYGLTEGGTAAATSPGDDVETIATTVGRPRPGFELRIADDKGAEVAAGETGEILLRGPSIMAGYLDDPEATAAALDDDGWLRTGDLGVVGDDGCLRIVGRAKDMFIVGGFNAYPAEIENFLLRHPDIAQAAVIGIPDPRLGEVGMAFVVTRPGAPATAPEIVAWCRENMANYKVPRAVDIVDELPLNATGKVAKNELRAHAATTHPVAPR